jgi:hypothetical protein
MQLYSDVIKQFESKFQELGLDQMESYFIREKGDQVLPDKLPDSVLTDLLNLEIQGRQLLKSMEARAKASQEQAFSKAKHEAIQDKLKLIIGREIPYARVREEFKQLWSGMITNTVDEALKLADWDLDLEGNLSLQANEKTTAYSELDKVLQQAKINKFSNQRTLEDVIHDSIVNSGVAKFFD